MPPVLHTNLLIPDQTRARPIIFIGHSFGGIVIKQVSDHQTTVCGQSSHRELGSV